MIYFQFNTFLCGKCQTQKWTDHTRTPGTQNAAWEIISWRPVLFIRCRGTGIWRKCLITQLVKNSPAMKETQFNSWVVKIPWRRNRLPTLVFLGLPCGPAGKEFTRNVRDWGLIRGLRRCPGEGKGYPLQYSGLENSWTVQSVGSQRVRGDFHFHLPTVISIDLFQ